MYNVLSAVGMNTSFISTSPVTREEKLREAIENSPPAVREILKDVNNRHIAIENSASDEDKAKQREDAIKLIKVMRNYTLN